MEKSSPIDRRNVEINVRLYIESFFSSGKKINHIGIYWPIKNEVDIRSLNDKYSLALPRCDKNKELLFCEWNGKQLTKDYEGKKSVNFGIYGIPETILINKDLKILKKYVGPLSSKDVREIQRIVKK